MEPQYSALTIIGYSALAFNSALAIRNSWGRDASSVAFVLGADAALLLLFLCLGMLERNRAAGRTRGRLKAAVWALTTLLTAMFASRVAPVMPPALGTVVWLMAAATTGGGFWAFFMI